MPNENQKSNIKVILKHGDEEDLARAGVVNGEPKWCPEDGKLYIGNGLVNVPINRKWVYDPVNKRLDLI